MVGFQTKLKHGEQVRILPHHSGLEHAEFARLAHSSQHLSQFAKTARPDATACRAAATSFAGQITGCEGYVDIRRDRFARRAFRRGLKQLGDR